LRESKLAPTVAALEFSACCFEYLAAEHFPPFGVRRMDVGSEYVRGVAAWSDEGLESLQVLCVPLSPEAIGLVVRSDGRWVAGSLVLYSFERSWRHESGPFLHAHRLAGVTSSSQSRRTHDFDYSWALLDVNFATAYDE
jgi:hypothetical protein